MEPVQRHDKERGEPCARDPKNGCVVVDGLLLEEAHGRTLGGSPARPEKGAHPRRADDENGDAASTTLPLSLADMPQQAFGKKREQRYERDAGIALVEVGPLGRIDGDPLEDLGKEFGIPTSVDERRIHTHSRV
jgi:hypothetical protein